MMTEDCVSRWFYHKSNQDCAAGQRDEVREECEKPAKKMKKNGPNPNL